MWSYTYLSDSTAHPDAGQISCEAVKPLPLGNQFFLCRFQGSCWAGSEVLNGSRHTHTWKERAAVLCQGPENRMHKGFILCVTPLPSRPQTVACLQIHPLPKA